MIKAEAEFQGKKVEIKLKGGHKHQGIVLGKDATFKDTYLVGITESTVPGANERGRNPEGYISIFHAKRKQIHVKEEKR